MGNKLYGAGRSRRLGLVERRDAREDFALEELERRAAARGDVGHLVREARLLDGRDGVAAADDGDAPLRRELRERVADGKRALGERVDFEDAHGAVPDDRLAVREFALDLGRGLGAVVEAHPAVGDRVLRHDLRVGRRVELVRHQDLGREDELAALLLRELHRRLGRLDVVVLDQRRADALAHGLEERERHAPPTMTLSHLLMSASRTVILDETLEPPTMAASGRTGSSTAPARYSSSFARR